MSIIRPVIRLCAVAALRMGTWAEQRVCDSDNTPLLQALDLNDDPKPYITVFTDDDDRQDIQGRDLAVADRRIRLVLEIGLASAVSVEGQDDQALEIPATDASMEMTIDLVEGQATDALFIDPHSEWGELLKSMAITVMRTSSMRGGSADKGARYAARQVVFVLSNVVADPVPGVPLADDHPIKRFIALAATQAGADAKVQNAGVILSRILDPVALPEWRQVQAWLGLTREGARYTGLGPQVYVDENAAQLGEEDSALTLEQVPSDES